MQNRDHIVRIYKENKTPLIAKYDYLLSNKRKIYPELKKLMLMIKSDARDHELERFATANRHLNISNVIDLLAFHEESRSFFKNANENEIKRFFIGVPQLNNHIVREEHKAFFYILSNTNSDFVHEYMTSLIQNEDVDRRTTIFEMLLDAYTLKNDFKKFSQNYQLYKKMSNDLRHDMHFLFQTIKTAFLSKNYEFINHLCENHGEIFGSYDFLSRKIINLNLYSNIETTFHVFNYLLVRSDAAYNLLEFFTKVALARRYIEDIFMDARTYYNCIEYTECGLTINWLKETAKKISDLIKNEGLDFNTAYKALNLTDNEAFWLSHYHKLMTLHPTLSTQNQQEIFLPRLPKPVCELINAYVFDQSIDQSKRMKEAVLKENLSTQIKKYVTYQDIWKNGKDPISATLHLLQHYQSPGDVSSKTNGFFRRVISGCWNHHHVALITNCLEHFKTVEKLSVQYILNYISAELKEKTPIKDINMKGDLMTRLLFIAKKTGTTLPIHEEILKQDEAPHSKSDVMPSNSVR